MSTSAFAVTQIETYVILDHKTSHMLLLKKIHSFDIDKIIDFSFMPEIIRIVIKGHVQ